MCRSRLGAVMSAMTAMVFTGAVPLLAQTASGNVATTEPASAGGTASKVTLPSPFHGGPLVTGINVWAGSAASIRTASHNEKFDASMAMVGVQFTRSLFVAKGIHFSWMVEVVPVILATVEAPSNRFPVNVGFDNEAAARRVLARYSRHDVYGFGFAPLSAEASKSLTDKLTTVFTVTSGGAFFTGVVPYGKATQANFTVAPTLGLEWRLSPTHAVAAGYTMHHLSNASFGASNPGMNSHILFVRLSRARFGGQPR